jgi:hypothetical protein
MASADDLARMVPGFDFLQGLLKNASAGLPNMGQWIAPTLNPEELDKRIQELKTVQFWLEQNAKVLGATIQGLEVQKLTLTTLQSMNLPLADLGEALKIRMPTVAAPPPPPPAPRAAAPAPEPDDEPDAPHTAAAPASSSPGKATAAATPAPLVDPMQWWGALTQQFTEIAAKAVKDSATDAALNLAGAVAKAPLAAARKAAAGAMKKATGSAAGRAAAPARKAAAKAPARKRTV